MILCVCPECGMELGEFDIRYDSGHVGFREPAFAPSYECKLCDNVIDEDEIDFDCLDR